MERLKHPRYCLMPIRKFSTKLWVPSRHTHIGDFDHKKEEEKMTKLIFETWRKWISMNAMYCHLYEFHRKYWNIVSKKENTKRANHRFWNWVKTKWPARWQERWRVIENESKINMIIVCIKFDWEQKKKVFKMKMWCWFFVYLKYGTENPKQNNKYLPDVG